ncbi:nucleotide sugar dehydrogenase [Pseudoclavibacter chungangensis]|uniref:Nucleotide sugar dehydrogenase n=1 Tax=Pseudoclavibacter chungangensis TaxID=587635 RepID=A0A7J5C1N8_9MICO|nr:nucleotide sugar dehydrogenase [Pseudoclavibacter chungangensis]KAB1662556.1 nucleotide sugar dehydrogenase [Pseudoclavibacter chungangensis]NYJ68600.1 nucleotide sugar dehydrogenase [Pseudoclavibacter chungangensis]
MSSTYTLTLDDAPVDGPAWKYDIAIVGMGYVGLPTALAFSAAGVRVLGIDAKAERLDAIRAGDVDLVPSDRARLYETNLMTPEERWRLSSDASEASQARAVIVCVPTPIDEHAVPDLRALRGACDALVDNARPGQVLILTSTSYPGCTRDFLVAPLAERGLRAGVDVHVAFSPERINPADETFTHEAVPRVVGGSSARCAEEAAEVLRQYVSTTHLVPTLEAAEMTKLLENTFRAVNVAFINEFANVCRSLDISVNDVIDAAATKPFGFMSFRPGPGVGGHCIPCDPHYLLWQLRSDHLQAPLLEQAMNDLAVRPRHVAERVRTLLGELGVPPKRARVTVVGVSYKPDVADVRESTAVEIIELLNREGIGVAFVDPYVSSLRLADGTVLEAGDAATDGHADVVLLHTRHSAMDLGWLAGHPGVLDASFSLGADIAHQQI